MRNHAIVLFFGLILALVAGSVSARECPVNITLPKASEISICENFHYDVLNGDAMRILRLRWLQFRPSPTDPSTNEWLPIRKGTIDTTNNGQFNIDHPGRYRLRYWGRDSEGRSCQGVKTLRVVGTCGKKSDPLPPKALPEVTPAAPVTPTPVTPTPTPPASVIPVDVPNSRTFDGTTFLVQLAKQSTDGLTPGFALESNGASVAINAANIKAVWFQQSAVGGVPSSTRVSGTFDKATYRITFSLPATTRGNIVVERTDGENTWTQVSGPSWKNNNGITLYTQGSEYSTILN